LRFDPLIYHEDYQSHYSEMFKLISESLNSSIIHSVSLGAFRMPEKFFKNMVKLYPRERLYAGGLVENNGMVSYSHDKEREMTDFCHNEIQKYWKSEIIFPCY